MSGTWTKNYQFCGRKVSARFFWKQHCTCAYEFFEEIQFFSLKTYSVVLYFSDFKQKVWTFSDFWAKQFVMVVKTAPSSPEELISIYFILFEEKINLKPFLILSTSFPHSQADHFMQACKNRNPWGKKNFLRRNRFLTWFF